VSLTNRDIASITIVILTGIALWMLPDQVRGDNRLFAANGTLLPAFALSLICALSALDLIRGLLASRRNGGFQDERHVDDVKVRGATLAGKLLVTILALLFAVSLRTVGFGPAAMVLVLSLMFGTGGRNPRVNLTVSILSVAILYVGVRYGLGVHIQLWPDLMHWVG
jgi:hypothetical protein